MCKNETPIKHPIISTVSRCSQNLHANCDDYNHEALYKIDTNAALPFSWGYLTLDSVIAPTVMHMQSFY